MALLPTWWPSTLGAIELLAALTIPVGLYAVISTMRAMRWSDLLVGVGMLLLPAVIILSIEKVFPPAAGALMIGLVLGHTMAMFDTD